MAFDTHISEFEGIPVKNFEPGSPPENLEGCVWRISIDWDQYDAGVTFSDLFAKLLEIPGASDMPGLVLGCWEGAGEGQGSDTAIEALVSARAQVPGLQHLFIGEMLQEECEVSWINQTDVSPIFLAFPNLITLQVRGMEGLSLGRPVHENLQKLVLEGGGMPSAIVNEVASAHLPNLTHLELWLGDEGYGRSVSQDDLQPILNGGLFPKLKYLGLRNDSDIDATVAWLKDAPILEQISVLDISLGTLSDAGADVLLENNKLKSLRRFVAFHHFLSDEAVENVKTALKGVEVDLREQQEADEYDGEINRYNFVSE